MCEYDVAIAMERSSGEEDGAIEIDFPESCVLYIRSHRELPKFHEAKIPSGCRTDKMTYRAYSVLLTICCR